MSMFHELMMRKKEQIMYATIEGTLTESPEGVFSGFSASNYLKLQQQFQPADKNWEIVIKTEITQLNVVQTIIGSSTNSNNIQLAIRDTNIIRFCRTTNGTTDVISNSSLTIDSLGVYYFKISFNGSQYKVSVSQDGNNYINYITTTSSTLIYNNSPRLAFGVNGRQMSTEYLRGSIDLNKSYIKIDNTKYKLQAVVGYTVVGSPTITDGVVSGFSLSNYVKISTSTLNIGTTDFEIQTSFIANSIATTNTRIFATDGSATTVLGFNLVANGNKLRFMYQGTNNYLDSSLSSYEANVKYYAKFYRKGNILGLEISTDKVNWIKDTKEYSGSLSFGNEFRLGVNVGGGTYFNGSIDLNETYVKINNKLWFNGQQA